MIHATTYSYLFQGGFITGDAGEGKTLKSSVHLRKPSVGSNLMLHVKAPVIDLALFTRGSSVSHTRDTQNK